MKRLLNSFLNRWFVALRSVYGAGNNTSFAGNARFATISVQFKQFANVELGFLQNLDFADVDIVQWVDSLASLFNILANGVGDELVDDLWNIK